MKKLSIIPLVLIVGLMGITAPAAGMTVDSTAANVDYDLQPSYPIEFEDPVPPETTVNGYYILEWRDADYEPGPDPPKNWEDWVPSDATIDGTSNQIWLRGYPDSASTITTVASDVVSIHLCGDDNDGHMDVMVDGAWVATVDGNTPGGGGGLILYVKDLANTTHKITVKAIDTSYPYDCAIYGGAALMARPIPTLNQWGMVILFLLLAAAATVVIFRKRRATA